MASGTVARTANSKAVGMGQIAAEREPATFTAVLGSCIGTAIYHPRLRVGAMAHVVLPESAGKTAPPGKFADTAIPHLICQLEQLGANRAGLIAKIAGGACMFGGDGPMKIGEANAESVIRALAQTGIRIVAKDLGGTKGRRVTFDCSSGDLIVETVGNPPRVL
jgi:chemotaxis protein CheD